MRKLWEALWNLLFPQPVGCQLCGKGTEGELCSVCRRDLDAWDNQPKCPVCGRPQWGKVGILCSQCYRERPPFDKAVAVGPYEGPLRGAIHDLKYKGHKYRVPTLGVLLVETLQRAPWLSECQLIVPVPLAPKRRRERGFNQAELLAAQVARAVGAPLAKDLLQKPTDTPPQTGLTREQRKQNLRGAFQVKDPEMIRGKNILVVDDVFTTGSTAHAVAQTLKEQGSGKVFVLTLANSSK